MRVGTALRAVQRGGFSPCGTRPMERTGFRPCGDVSSTHTSDGDATFSIQMELPQTGWPMV